MTDWQNKAVSTVLTSLAAFIGSLIPLFLH